MKKLLCIVGSLVLTSSFVSAAGTPVGTKIDATWEQIQAACIMQGHIKGVPVLLNEKKVLVYNPLGVKFGTNDIPSVKEAKRVIKNASR